MLVCLTVLSLISSGLCIDSLLYPYSDVFLDAFGPSTWTSILEMTEPNKMDRTFICNLLLYLQKISLFKHPRVLSSVSTLWNVLPSSFQTSCCSESPLNIFLFHKIVANYFNSLQFPLSLNDLTFIYFCHYFWKLHRFYHIFFS